MQYTVKEIHSFSEQTYGQAKNHRAVVSVHDGQGNQKCSAFLKVKPNVGDVWNGIIKETEKDGRTYFNFEFERKSANAGGAEVKNYLEFKIMPMLVEIRSLLQNGEQNKYPKQDDTNAADFW